MNKQKQTMSEFSDLILAGSGTEIVLKNSTDAARIQFELWPPADGTVSVLQSVDGETFRLASVTQSLTGSTFTSISEAGLYTAEIPGIKTLKVRVVDTGTIVGSVSGNFSGVPFDSGAALGGGSSAFGSPSYGLNYAFGGSISNAREVKVQASRALATETIVGVPQFQVMRTGASVSFVQPTAAAAQVFLTLGANDGQIAAEGARTITVHGLDASLEEVSETVSQNGTQRLFTLTNQYRVIDDVVVQTAGDSLTNIDSIAIGSAKTGLDSNPVLTNHMFVLPSQSGRGGTGLRGIPQGSRTAITGIHGSFETKEGTVSGYQIQEFIIDASGSRTRQLFAESFRNVGLIERKFDPPIFTSEGAVMWYINAVAGSGSLSTELTIDSIIFS